MGLRFFIGKAFLYYFRRGNTARQGFRRKLQKGAAILQTKCAFAGFGIGEGIAPVLGEGEGFGLHGGVLTAGDLYIQDERYPVCINEGVLRDGVTENGVSQYRYAELILLLSYSLGLI